jgi:hypothetical protein
MRIDVAVLALALVGPTTAEALPAPPGAAGNSTGGQFVRVVPSAGLRAAIVRETARLARDGVTAGKDAGLSQPTASAPPSGNWVKRHPKWFGAMVGSTAGALIVGLTVHSEAAFLGFYGGAALGATTGWIVSRRP